MNKTISISRGWFLFLAVVTSMMAPIAGLTWGAFLLFQGERRIGGIITVLSLAVLIIVATVIAPMMGGEVSEPTIIIDPSKAN